ncbi:MAG: SDR family oxidoreductase [Deltaproteobacteria bacterium]|jgi:NAD(P)-dependent dehydrogenase (short-subunit alcohol dehydrogenase family)|nr:SDR family oxidoreductase [Deltaproteobacteria bacterium]MBW2696726.1 SDR family oxidoreductase [Deltaproteobacteria bacterium]
MDVAGKHVVVTGGASGIGEAMCRRFAAEKAHGVVVADVNAVGAERVAKEIGGLGVAVDVSDESQIQALVRKAENEFGPIDLFCSNAGIGVGGGVEAASEDWQRIWEINVMSHVYAARAVLPSMIERGEGYLLNTCSAAGLLSQIGSAPYSVTKHAAVGLAESLAIAHGDQGIRVSALCPQAVRTAMTAGAEGGGVAGVDGMLEPDEVAQIVVEGLAAEHFLILPHPIVEKYMRRKVDDYDRWLAGMRRLQSQFPGGGIPKRS